VSRPFTPEGFTEYVDAELSWRIRELSDVKQAAREGHPSYRPALRKAALPLVYAHWEGYIKFVAESYLRYVAARKLRLSRLSTELHSAALHSFFERHFGSKPGFSERPHIASQIVSIQQMIFKAVPKDCVNTGSNLSSSRTAEICSLIGIKFEDLGIEADWLDKQLLDKRNHIAHGAEKSVTEDELNGAIARVIEGMRSMKIMAETLVSNESFRLPLPSA
jgi:hypothetical protein